MSYAPLKVRYGTAVEPWHSLSQWYHAGTTLPLKRDYTTRPRRYTPTWSPVPGLGQAGVSFGTLIYGSLAAAFAAGALTMHLMHRYRVLGMNRRPRRNRRR
jgi:hypothetical protein